MGREHDSARLEVTGSRGIALLAGGVQGQVKGPTKQQIACSSKESADGRVTQSFPEFVHHLLADRSALELLVGRIQRRKTKESAGLGDKDLILGQMAGGSVVLAVSDAPRMKWDTESRVKDPTNGIIDKFGLRKGLVTAFMGNDPKAGRDETSPETIQRPERKLAGPVKDRERELDYLRMNAGIEEGGGLVDSSQGSKICDNVE